MTPPPRRPPKIPRPHPAPLAASPVITALAAAVADAPDRAAADRLVADFWDGPARRTPLIESVPDAPDDRVATFVWRDRVAEQVLLFVNRMTDERSLGDSLMQRVPGTDVWHLSYRMRADWRASYAFLVRERGHPAPWTDGQDHVAVRAALDRGRVDPRNPQRGRNRDGIPQSVVTLPAAAPEPPTSGTPAVAVLALTGPDDRRIWWCEPADGAPAGSPVVIVLDGEVWVHTQDLPGMLDAAWEQAELPPAVVIFVDSGGREQRWRDMDAGGDAVDWLADRLLPWVAEVRGEVPDPSTVVVAGQSLGGLTALRLGITRPDAVGRVISQSASLWQDDFDEALRENAVSHLRVHVQVGEQEWVLREPNRDLAGRLGEAGAFVRYAEYNGGHDYACWRVGMLEGLRAVLPR